MATVTQKSKHARTRNGYCADTGDRPSRFRSHTSVSLEVVSLKYYKGILTSNFYALLNLCFVLKRFLGAIAISISVEPSGQELIEDAMFVSKIRATFEVKTADLQLTTEDRK